jgi:hypothetical protein
LAFLVSAVLFLVVKHYILFMYPQWDMAYGVPALAGFIVAVIGIIRAALSKQLSVLSVVGAALSAAPVLFMALVFSLARMH